MTDHPDSYGAGLRLPYAELPAAVREWVEDRLPGPVVEVRDRRGGFSPGVAASVHTADGGLFVKAVTDAINVDSLQMYRNERDRGARLPDLPGILTPNGSTELIADGRQWIAIIFPLLDGAPPRHPWSFEDAIRTLDQVDRLGAALSPTPWPRSEDASAATIEFLTGWPAIADARDTAPWAGDPWVAERIGPLQTLTHEVRQQIPGDSLIHLDLRADNIMIDSESVWLVDWAHACNAARWVDPVLLVADFMASGADIADGGEIDIAGLLRDHPALAPVSARVQLGLLSGLAASIHLASRKPAAPGLPTIRGWQARTADAMLGFVKRHLDAVL